MTTQELLRVSDVTQADLRGWQIPLSRHLAPIRVLHPVLQPPEEASEGGEKGQTLCFPLYNPLGNRAEIQS